MSSPHRGQILSRRPTQPFTHQGFDASHKLPVPDGPDAKFSGAIVHRNRRPPIQDSLYRVRHSLRCERTASASRACCWPLGQYSGTSPVTYRSMTASRWPSCLADEKATMATVE